MKDKIKLPKYKIGDVVLVRNYEDYRKEDYRVYEIRQEVVTAAMSFIEEDYEEKESELSWYYYTDLTTDDYDWIVEDEIICKLK